MLGADRTGQNGGRAGGRASVTLSYELIWRGRVQSSGTLSRPINFTARPLLIGPAAAAAAARPLLLCSNRTPNPLHAVRSEKDSLLQDFIGEINTPSLFYFTRARTHAPAFRPRRISTERARVFKRIFVRENAPARAVFRRRRARRGKKKQKSRTERFTRASKRPNESRVDRILKLLYDKPLPGSRNPNG